MQFKKLAAITGSALMAGLSLAAPVLATSVTKLSDINKLVGAVDSTVNFPIFVIGARAATSDVAGAVDVAVNLASYAVKTSTVITPGTAAGITGGVSMATTTNPLTMWDAFASSKQVLTTNDLPDILNSGNYVDANSVSYPFSQYLTFTNNANNGRIVYDTPSGGTSPALGLKFAQTYPVYNYQLAFTKQISEAVTSNLVTYMGNTQIKMMGRDWTITSATVSASDNLALTLLSGKNSQTVTTEASATYVVGDKTYTVKLVAVGQINNVDAATIAVSGGNLAAEETLQILTGGTKSPIGDPSLMIGVTSIFKTTKTGAIDSATVFVGADKLELQDTNIADTSGTAGFYAGVKLNGQTVNDVTVRMTGACTLTSNAGTLTLNSLEVQWAPSLEQFISSGNSILDPAFGGFKIFFGGVSPAIDDTASRELISVTPSGTTATLAFKTVDGNSLSTNFVRSTGAGATTNVDLEDAAQYDFHVLEGEAVTQNQYVVLGQNSLAGNAQNPFGHILRVLTIQNVSTSTSQFQDIASGTTLQVTGGNTTLYLDGQQYKVCAATTSTIYFVWGDGSTCVGGVNVGTAYDLFPAIQTSKGGWVAITDPTTISGLSTNGLYNLSLPTGSLSFVPNATTATGVGVQTVGGVVKYNVSATAGGTSVTVYATNSGTTNINYYTPGVLFIEGLDESTTRNAISLLLQGDTAYQRVDIGGAPAFTGTTTTTAGVSGTTQNKYVDKFGSYVLYDSTAPGLFSVSYPTSQAQATVGVGKSPSASGGGVGGTITTQTVLPITTDVVYLDNDPAVASLKTTKDLVLIGGPCINDLVKELATAGSFPYTCDNWPGRNFGRVQLIADAFATGKTALVIAGTRAEETDLAAQMVQGGFNGASATIKAGTTTEITGSVTSPAYT